MSKETKIENNIIIGDLGPCFNEETMFYYHIFIPITWSLTPQMKTAHEFMCQRCLKLVTRTDIGEANEH